MIAEEPLIVVLHKGHQHCSDDGHHPCRQKNNLHSLTQHEHVTCQPGKEIDAEQFVKGGWQQCR